MKHVFKVGDLVRHKVPHYGPKRPGVVIDVKIDENDLQISRVRWPSMEVPYWYYSVNLKHAENPIQRMRRLYESRR